MNIIFCILLGYLLGSVNPSYLFGKTKGYDMRKDGSGNAGATNAFILVGAKAFFVTALLDILKAFAAFRICQGLFPDLLIAGPLAGAACIIGHIYPVFLRFHGGKGLASLGGVILAWNWKWFLLLLAAALAIAFATRYVCLAAPTISIVFPACYYYDTRHALAALILLLPSIPILIKHKDNFLRIRTGEEMRTSFLWNKEAELKRIGKWNPTTEEQLERRNK